MLGFASVDSRHAVGRVFVGALAGAALCGTTGVATADPAPAGCTAADLAQVSATVASETHAYLIAHPDVNDFFTSLEGRQGGGVQQQVEGFMNSHPQVHADLQRIRQPRTDLLNRCGWSSATLPD